MNKVTTSEGLLAACYEDVLRYAWEGSHTVEESKTEERRETVHHHPLPYTRTGLGAGAQLPVESECHEERVVALLRR